MKRVERVRWVCGLTLTVLLATLLPAPRLARAAESLPPAATPLAAASTSVISETVTGLPLSSLTPEATSILSETMAESPLPLPLPEATHVLSETIVETPLPTPSATTPISGTGLGLRIPANARQHAGQNRLTPQGWEVAATYGPPRMAQTWRLSDGRVQLSAPTGAVTEALEITVVTYETPASARPAAQLPLQFTLGPDMTFQKPLTLTIALQDIIDLDQLPQGWRPVLIYIEDAERGLWELVPGQSVDWQQGTLTAPLEHFSDYGVGTITENGWHLIFNDANVAQFRGSLTYQYPIEVPAGRGGLQPQLALDYNSERIEGVFSTLQADWVGLGWSLDVPQIVREVSWCPWGGGQVCTDLAHPQYTLVLNGTGYPLIPDKDINPAEDAPAHGVGRYYTQEDAQLWIQKIATTHNEKG